MNAHRKILTEDRYIYQLRFLNGAITDGERRYEQAQLQLLAKEIDQADADRISGALASLKQQRADLLAAWAAQSRQDSTAEIETQSAEQAEAAKLAAAALNEAGQHFVKLMEHIRAIGPIVDARRAAIDRALEHLSPHRRAFAEDPTRGQHAYSEFAHDVRSHRLEGPLILGALYQAGLAELGAAKSDQKFSGGDVDVKSYVSRWKQSLTSHFRRLFGDT